MMKIFSNFDSGSIKVVSADVEGNIDLQLIKDNAADVSQWFYFTVQTIANSKLNISIANAGESSFARAWQSYQALASYDQVHWFRVPTTFDGQRLVITHQPVEGTVSYAYFTPYSSAQHQQLLSKAQQSPWCRYQSLGQTGDGNTIDLLTIGAEAKAKNKVWLIARQHPGETMAQWFMEGTINRLLSGDELSTALLEDTVFYVVANMNPDGSKRGNHRTNAQGVNLNRQWHNPSEVNCPEVYFVRQAMQNKGVDLFLDIHGDEEIPYNFIMAGAATEALKQQATVFKAHFADASQDFQTEYDYDSYHAQQTGCCKSTCGQHHLATATATATATAYVADTFQCLALLLEMPFIDNANHPDVDSGWSAPRSVALGQAVLQPIYQALNTATHQQLATQPLVPVVIATQSSKCCNN